MSEPRLLVTVPGETLRRAIGTPPEGADIELWDMDSPAPADHIDREHLDHYADLADIAGAFVSFVNKVPFYGAAILCTDDENVRAILPQVHRRVVSYGLEGEPEVQATNLQLKGLTSEFAARVGREDWGPFKLHMPGLHNVRNALAALATAAAAGVDLEKARAALAEFRGVKRRLEVRGVVDGISVYDDFAHHPTAVR